MKLRTRLVISFMVIVIIPVVLTGVMTWGVAQYQINMIEKTYGITGSQYQTFAHSLTALKAMPEVQSFMFMMVVSIILIMFFTGMVLMLWTYGALIVPIEKLQRAAKNIKEGN